MVNKFFSLIKTIRLYKNWPLVLRLSFGNFKNWPVVIQLRNGIKYNLHNEGDLHVLKEIWTFNHYGKFLDYIKDGSVVIDIGSHIGIFSIRAAKRAHDVQVFSFEPLPENFKILKSNIEINNLEKNIILFPLAVSGDGEERNLNILARTGSSITNDFKGGFSGRIKTPTITLKKIFDDNEIDCCDFLKIDCEGAEYEILYNTPPEILKRVKTITLESHDYFRDKKGELKKILEDNGFIVDVEKNNFSEKTPVIWTNLLFAARKN
jgi:FkbM family methyltransferase